MSIGSAFDAYIKCYMYKALFGNEGPTVSHRIGNGEVIDAPEFNLEILFQAQVEEHNREWAEENVGYVFSSYLESGAMAALMSMLEAASEEPKFEFTITKKIQTMLGEVTLLGKPDVWFITRDGRTVIFDWKVNGYCSKSAKSPEKGFVIIRDGFASGLLPPSRGANKPHKLYVPDFFCGIPYNSGFTLDQAYPLWAQQLSIYAWLLGEEVGGEFLCCIDQIVAKPVSTGFPILRVASHRSMIPRTWQQSWMAKVVNVWDRAHANDFIDPQRKILLDSIYLYKDDDDED
jgi:hypothetical protein